MDDSQGVAHHRVTMTADEKRLEIAISMNIIGSCVSLNSLPKMSASARSASYPSRTL